MKTKAHYDVFVTVDGVESQVLAKYPEASKAGVIRRARLWRRMEGKPAPASDRAYRVIESTPTEDTA